MSELGFNTSTDTNYQAQYTQARGQLDHLKQEFMSPSDGDHQKLKKAAQEFEAIFFKQIIEKMDQTVERGDLFGGGEAEGMFRSMMFDEISLRAAKRPGGSGLGIAELVYKQMSQQLKPDSTTDVKSEAP